MSYDFRIPLVSYHSRTPHSPLGLCVMRPRMHHSLNIKNNTQNRRLSARSFTYMRAIVPYLTIVMITDTRQKMPNAFFLRCVKYFYIKIN